MAPRTAVMSFRSPTTISAKNREVLGALICAEYEGPHRQPSSEQLSDGEVTGRSVSSARARDQKFCNGVLCHECLRKVIVECKLQSRLSICS
jgi:hypothetical protein